MIAAVLKEKFPETRVSLLPEHIAFFTKNNVEVDVESGAGTSAFATDKAYTEAGAKIKSREEILASADVILCLHAPAVAELEKLKNKILVGFYQPLNQPEVVPTWTANNITVFSMDMLPRTTRAQSMDVLSSQANIAGYKAVLTAAQLYSRYFPMFMTAAGSIPPAKVLILGAGVAGLQAIATARRLGAVVEVFDTRPAVKEEVMSLGGKFVEVEGAADASKAGGYAVEQSMEFLQKQKEKIAERVAKSDIIISTAQIPGRKAPILVTTEMLRAMKTGSIIIDLAASTGGNTDETKDGETIDFEGVSIIGNSALPCMMPSDASKLYGKNICNFLQLIISPEGNIALNFEDDLVEGACATHNGNVVNSRLQSVLNKN